jgi:hypothetical protein
MASAFDDQHDALLFWNNGDVPVRYVKSPEGILLNLTSKIFEKRDGIQDDLLH